MQPNAVMPLSAIQAVHCGKGLGVRRFSRGDTRRDTTSAEYALSPNSFLCNPRGDPRCIRIAGFQNKCLFEMPRVAFMWERSGQGISISYVSQAWAVSWKQAAFLVFIPGDDANIQPAVFPGTGPQSY